MSLGFLREVFRSWRDGGKIIRSTMIKKQKQLRIRNSTAEFLIFTSQAGEDSIEVRISDENVWLTQKLIAKLFGVGQPAIAKHFKNIFSSGELEED